MHGARRRMQATAEQSLAQAWHTERFARENPLKPMKEYLEELRPSPPRRKTGAEIAARLDAMIASGAPISRKELH